MQPFCRLLLVFDDLGVAGNCRYLLVRRNNMKLQQTADFSGNHPGRFLPSALSHPSSSHSYQAYQTYLQIDAAIQECPFLHDESQIGMELPPEIVTSRIIWLSVCWLVRGPKARKSTKVLSRVLLRNRGALRNASKSIDTGGFMWRTTLASRQTCNRIAQISPLGQGVNSLGASLH